MHISAPRRGPDWAAPACSVAPVLFFGAIPSPSSGALHIGDLQLRAYGFLIALGVVAAVWLAQRRAPSRGIEPEHVQAVAFGSVLAGLIGARLYHVLTSWSSFSDRPGDIVKVWHGGLGVPGGLLAGVVVGVLLAKRRGVVGVDMLDVCVPSLALGQAIGRIGNWFNQELFGRPTSLPWGLEIDVEHRPARYADQPTFHPAFLYESLWNFALVAVLIYVDRKHRLARGHLIGVYLVGYGVGRLWIEALRIDPAGHLFGVRVNIWVSLLAIAAGIVTIVRGLRTRSGAGPAAAATPEPATSE